MPGDAGKVIGVYFFWKIFRFLVKNIPDRRQQFLRLHRLEQAATVKVSLYTLLQTNPIRGFFAVEMGAS